MIFRSPCADVTIPDVPLTSYIFHHTWERADKPALIDGASGRALTYGQLTEAIYRAAAGLAARGFRRGEVFAIYCPNLPEYAVVLHAVLMLSGTVTTVNPLYTVRELAHQLQDAGARYLLTVPPFLATARAVAMQSPVRELFVLGEVAGVTPFAAVLQPQGRAPGVPLAPGADLAILPYSSGTTGLPKGVMLTHRSVVANLTQLDAAAAGEVRLQADDVVLGVLPFFHVFGMILIMNYALRTGATVVTLPRFELEPCLRLMQDSRVSYAYLVPPLVLTLAPHPRVDAYDLSPLRFIACGAAPLGVEVAQACSARLGCRLAQGYGMTEASPVVSIDPVLPGIDKLGSVGPIVPNTEARVVDLTTGVPLGPHQQGEICIRDPQAMQGYLNNLAATAATIATEGWLHTGDVGYANSEGYFYLVDRVKELIKYKGFQVAPAELEALLLTHPAVADAAVIGRPDAEAGEVPIAFVVLQGNATSQELMGFVSERVAPYKRLRHVACVAQIPKSPTGKILRRVLVEQEQTGQRPV